MSTRNFSTTSSFMVVGMFCASIAMLTQNSTAVASHAVEPTQRVSAPVVTELPSVVIIGKRMKASDKANYLPQRKLLPVTLV
jgi:hypothetical protein